MEIRNRQATQADYSWLYDLKMASMRKYIEQVYGWDDLVQEEYFKRDFFPERVTIITVDGTDAGMYILSKNEEGYFLERIEVHPIFQNRGIGSKVIQEILSKAAYSGENVQLMVFKINPAFRLYKRLGFKVVRETKTHYEMKCVLEV